jgi:hypothetical protein
VYTNTATLDTATRFTVLTTLCNDLINFTPAAYARLIPSGEGEFLEPKMSEEVENTRLTDLEPNLLLPPVVKELIIISATTTPPEWLKIQFQDPSSLIEGEPEQTSSPQALWKHWHQRLGHLSKICMRAMAQAGRLPNNC